MGSRGVGGWVGPCDPIENWARRQRHTPGTTFFVIHPHILHTSTPTGTTPTTTMLRCRRIRRVAACRACTPVRVAAPLTSPAFPTHNAASPHPFHRKMDSSDEEDEKCPLCCETLDITDQNFFPCPCGYQVGGGRTAAGWGGEGGSLLVPRGTPRS